MIFRPEVARLIERGRKTMTRRLVTARDQVWPTVFVCPYDVGADYPVERPRRKRHPGETLPARDPAEHRVTVTAVRRELLGAISHADARLEGVRNVVEFQALWVRTHDAAWVAAREPDPETDPLADHVLCARFTVRHARRPVWVVAFELIEDRPTFLTASPIRSERDYTMNPGDAAVGEPEVMDPAMLHVDWDVRSKILSSAAAADVDAARLSGLVHPDEQLRELRRLALERGVDISEDVRVIEQRYAAIQRRLDEIQRKVSARHQAA